MFLKVNPAYCELTGYDADELVGKSFGDLWSPAIRPSFAQAFTSLIENDLVQSDLHLVRKDGSVAQVVLNGRVQRDEQGRFIRTHLHLV